MEVSASYIKSLLDKYVAEQGGAAVIAQENGLEYVDREKCEYYIFNIIYKVARAIDKRTSHHFFTTDIQPVWVNANTVELQVNTDKLRRNSLYEGGEPLENVLKLWVRGRVRTTKPIYGEWHLGTGEVIETSGAQASFADPFLEEIVDRFNSEYAGKVHAVIADDYKVGPNVLPDIMRHIHKR